MMMMMNRASTARNIKVACVFQWLERNQITPGAPPTLFIFFCLSLLIVAQDSFREHRARKENGKMKKKLF